MALTKAHNRMIAGAYVNVLDFGATGDGTTDDTAAIQAALDYAKSSNNNTVFFPAGEYLVTSTLTVAATRTVGYFNTVNLIGVAAHASIIKSTLNTGAIIDYTQGASQAYHLQVQISNLGIEQSVAGTDAIGIRMSACVFSKISMCRFQNLDGDCVLFNNANGDFDFTVEWTLEHNFFRNCGGRAIATSTPATGGVASVRLIANRVENCNGAFDVSGQGGEIVLNTIANVAGSPTNPDIRLRQDLTTPTKWSFRNNWLEKGRVGAFLIEGGLDCDFYQNAIIYNDTSSGAYGFKMVGSGAKHRNRFWGNRFVIDPAITFVAYQDDANTRACEILESHFQVFAGASHTKYDLDQGTGWAIKEEGLQLLSQKQKMVASTNSGGSYTPDLLAGTVHRPIFNTAATITINNPTGYATSGTELTLIIINGTGGAITPTFDTMYAAQSVPSIPGSSQIASARFFYDPVSNLFRQIGGWSI